MPGVFAESVRAQAFRILNHSRVIPMTYKMATCHYLFVVVFVFVVVVFVFVVVFGVIFVVVFVCV